MPPVLEMSLQNPDEITAWLQQIDLLQGRAVLAVKVKPARRPVSLVTLSDGTALFIKRLDNNNTLPFTLREVNFMKIAAKQEEIAVYHHVMPELYYYDENSHTLVTEGLAHYSTFQEYYDSHPIYDPTVLVRLGSQLAQCHQTSLNFKKHNDDNSIIHLHPPIPTYGNITPTQFAHASGREFPIYLRRMQSITDALRALKDDWTPCCLIHGDFKGDNIMLLLEGEPTIKFVDWELVGWGDPLWDVGSFIGQLIVYWVMSIRPTKDKSFLSWLSNASIPFDTIQASIAHFLMAYNGSWKRHLHEEEYQQTKIVQYAGLFLLHRAFISLELTGSLSSNAYCCLHLGKTLVSTPQYGTKILLLNIPL